MFRAYLMCYFNETVWIISDSELLGMLPKGTRTLLGQPIFPSPILSSSQVSQPEKVEGFVLLASTVDYAYSDKDKAWIVAVANKFRGRDIR